MVENLVTQRYAIASSVKCSNSAFILYEYSGFFLLSPTTESDCENIRTVFETGLGGGKKWGVERGVRSSLLMVTNSRKCTSTCHCKLFSNVCTSPKWEFVQITVYSLVILAYRNYFKLFIRGKKWIPEIRCQTISGGVSCVSTSPYFRKVPIQAIRAIFYSTNFSVSDFCTFNSLSAQKREKNAPVHL